MWLGTTEGSRRHAVSGTRQELLRCRVSEAMENRTDLPTMRCDHRKTPGSFLTNDRQHSTEGFALQAGGTPARSASGHKKKGWF